MSLTSHITTHTLSTTSATMPQRPGLSRRRALLSLAALPGAALLAACGGESAETVGQNPQGEPESSDAGGEQPAADDALITVTDPWVKAAEDGMTSAFGTITNTTDAELTLVSVTTEASEEMELHQTSSDGAGGMSMEEKEGGFPIPAGSDLVLEPGGDHIMLMSLTGPLQPGDEVELVLQFEDGSEQPISATVKDFAGAEEDYDPDEHGDHDHDDHDDQDHGEDEEHDHGDDPGHGDEGDGEEDQ